MLANRNVFRYPHFTHKLTHTRMFPSPMTLVLVSPTSFATSRIRTETADETKSYTADS